MNYLADPGGRFSSDVHRRVLGHLTYPDDTYAWSVPALVGRMLPDVGTAINSVDEMSQVLQELENEGHAQKIQAPNGLEVWKMTESGYETLQAGLPNEPPPGAAVTGPALIGDGGATSLESTEIPPAQPTEGVADVHQGVGGVPTEDPPAEQAQPVPSQPATGEGNAGNTPS